MDAISESEIVVSLTFDDNFVQHVAVTLCSLFENNEHQRFKVYLVHSRISRSNRSKLNLFIEKYQHNIIFSEIDRSRHIKQFKMSGHASAANYFRIFLPDIIQESKVLYLDSDVLVIGDINPLWSLDITKHFIAAFKSENL